MNPSNNPVEKLTDPTTTILDIGEVAALLGVSKAHCYDTIAKEGALAGLPVIRVGKRIKVPAAPVRILLGITQNLSNPTTTP